MGEKPTAEIEARGLRAYEQARAFERMRTWRLPVTYALASVLPLAFGGVAWRLGYSPLLAAGILFSIFITGRVFLEWKRLHRQYAENLALLATLEKTYGVELPWVQVEHHFAALEELQREIAEDQDKG